MLNFIQRYINKEVIKISAIFALAYCIMFNSAILFHKFEYYQSVILIAIPELLKEFLYNFIILFIFFLGLSIHRYIFIIGSLFLFVTGAIASYYLYFLGVSPSLSVMQAILNTNYVEATELISLKLIAWCSLSVCICIYCIRRYVPSNSLKIPTRIITFICMVVVISNIISPKYSFLKFSFPFQYLHNSYLLYVKQTTDFLRDDISLKYDFIDNSDDEVVAILVIGESARYGNFGVNGYERNTTPNLSKIDDLLSYKAISCSATTDLSVPCMLSRFGEKDIDKIEKETSFLSILTKLNFDTLWLGTQSIRKSYRNKFSGSFYDDVKFHMIPGGSLVFLPNDLDMKMIPYLQQHLKNDGKKFIVMHSTGSHWNYSARYTKEFEKFTPAISFQSKVDPSDYTKEELINTYDNSILYTDYFLSETINQLKNKNAFLIYVSDHGESLGESGRLTHGREEYVKEQREVPLFIWFSDKYKQKHPQKWEAVKSFKGQVLSHDYIFHSILDCIGVESEIIDKSLSLCRKVNYE
jgi:glucan phosphoethanolaminetransferase (alkaline phosphatase superfamily)